MEEQSGAAPSGAAPSGAAPKAGATETEEVVKLDLACGTKKHGIEYTGVDISPECKPDLLMDLLEFPWAIVNNWVDEIYCSHFIEHVPVPCMACRNEKDPLIAFFEECWRVLKPGGKMTLRWPSCRSDLAFQHLMHRRYLSSAFLTCLSADGRQKTDATQYGIECNFEIVEIGVLKSPGAPDSDSIPGDLLWNVDAEYVATLKAIK